MSWHVSRKLRSGVVGVFRGMIQIDYAAVEALLTRYYNKRWAIILCHFWLPMRAALGARLYRSRMCPSPDSVTRLVVTMLREGAVYVDAGAAFGQMAMAASACVGPQGQVHTFEPHPMLFARLERSFSIAKFSNIRLNRLLLAENEGKLSFFLHPQNRSSSVSQAYNPVSDLVEIECEATTLDAYCQRYGNDKAAALLLVDLIKLDVEGYEFSVLRGASRLLRSEHPMLILEVRDRESRIRAFGYSVGDMMAYLSDIGYSFYVSRQSRLKVITGESDFLDTDEDLVCVHPGGRLYEHVSKNLLGNRF